MSENEKTNLTENQCDFDNEQTENSEVETITASNSVQVSHGTSKIPDHILQQPEAKGTEVDPNDVIIVEQVSHESLGESSSESLGCKVIYEFPTEDESKDESTECKVTYEFLNDRENGNISHLSEAGVKFSHKIPRESDHAEYHSVPQITEKSKEKLVKTFNSKTLREESSDDTCATGTLTESDRKRKKDSISFMQSKRHKEVEISTTPKTQSARENGNIREDKSSDHSSDEFADIEDNVKDSYSSDNCDSNAIIETAATQMPVKDLNSDISQRNKAIDKSLDENKALNSDNSPNDKSLDKTAEKNPFASSLKGETIPVIKFPDDTKRKFELSLPTINEIRESESDEQLLEPKKSNSNPLIMKTSVVKRKDRCNVCNARLGLCAIKCRCGGYYCAKHRYDKEHNCTFDYKAMAAAEIKRNNPRIVAEKVRKL